MPTDELNASEHDESEDSHHDNSDTKDDVKSHPDYQELEKKYAAARQGMDKSNLTKKQLEAEVAKYKTLAGVKEEPEETEEKPLTRAELQEQLWELKNAKDVEIYSDEEYEQDIKNGIPRDYALKTAKLRAQANPDKARLDRQKQMASGSSGHREIDDQDFTEKDRQDMAKWGYSEEALRKHKQLQKERGQI
jgi:hypothetical protein